MAGGISSNAIQSEGDGINSNYTERPAQKYMGKPNS